MPVYTTQTDRPTQLAKTAAELPESVDDVTAIVNFLASFQQMMDPRAQAPSRLISLKVPVPLLVAFRAKAKLAGVPYQTMIKRLMVEWLKGG